MASIPNQQVNDALDNLNSRETWIGAYHGEEFSSYGYSTGRFYILYTFILLIIVFENNKGRNSWMWSDGSDWRFNKWGKDEPKTKDGRVEHVRMESSWVDGWSSSVNDEDTHPYFCQHEVVG